ncbi:hypothetical protein SSCG_06345 [Streptomyces clavuligerus]|nr:hypothetical protein SSCG_06345 [Streptomyces clavuligerus]
MAAQLLAAEPARRRLRGARRGLPRSVGRDALGAQRRLAVDLFFFFFFFFFFFLSRS